MTVSQTFANNLAYLVNCGTTTICPLSPDRLALLVSLSESATVEEVELVAKWAKVSLHSLLTQQLGDTNVASHPHIQLLALDVDGTLTDCGIYIGPSGEEYKRFDAKDGIAIKRLVRSGVQVGFLSNSIQRELLEHRAKMLDVQRVHAAHGQKADVLDNWRRDMGLDWSQVAYMGDDVNDLKCLALAGLAGCPADAAPEVRRVAHFVTQARGGYAAVREFIHHCLLPIV
jgi:YrbI family 3-deoxy-D-manno-octulosonate 8-phosphate phosphatase